MKVPNALRYIPKSALAIVVSLLAVGGAFLTFPHVFAANATDMAVRTATRGVGDSTFYNTYYTEPGKQIEVRIDFQNNSTEQIKDVTVLGDIKSTPSFDYVAGSTVKSSSEGNDIALPDGVTSSGVNIGGFLASGDAQVKYTLVTPAADKLTCGDTTFTNQAIVTSAVGQNSAESKIVVTKKCDTTTANPATTTTTTTAPKMINVCKLSSRSMIEIREADFNSNIYRKDSCPDETPVATTTTTTTTSAPKTITVCKLSDRSLVEIKEADFNSNIYRKDGCPTEEAVTTTTTTESTIAPKIKQTVCRLRDRVITKISPNNYNSNLYAWGDSCPSTETTTDTTTETTTTASPLKMTVCRLRDKVVTTINKSIYNSNLYKPGSSCPTTTTATTTTTDTTKTETTPIADNLDSTSSTTTTTAAEDTTTTATTSTKESTVSNLASTGPAEVLSGVAGTSALGYASYMFYTSRRKLARS